MCLNGKACSGHTAVSKERERETERERRDGTERGKGRERERGGGGLGGGGEREKMPVYSYINFTTMLHIIARKVCCLGARGWGQAPTHSTKTANTDLPIAFFFFLFFKCYVR